MPADRVPRKSHPRPRTPAPVEVPYRAVLAAALDPIVTIDEAGVIQSASDSVQRVFGWEAAELIGKNVSLLMPGAHRSAQRGDLVEFLETGRTEHLNHARQFQAVRKDGFLFPVEVSLSRVKVPGEAAPLFVGIIRDLSEHATADEGERGGLDPRAEQGRPSDSSRLHELLAEQTSALQAAYSRLRMSDRLASIGALAAGLGHDMNNVLLPVRAHLEAARAGALVPEVRRHVDAVQKSVVYLQQLADGLHFLARDTEGDDSERAATDVGVWWAQVGPLLTNAVPVHVNVAVSIPVGLPEVAVSAHGLSQVVLNLVVNAGEAIPPPAALPDTRKCRQGRVRIAARADESGSHVTLRVTDNGQGMSEETRRRAMEMFYTTKARGLGTGLGLPLVARVISRAGGSVHIESRLGAGTTVSVLLPVARRSEHQSHAPCAVIAVSDGRAAAMIQHLLRATGIRVASSSDPDQSDIWIAESTGEGLEGAQEWRRRRPRGGLVLFGAAEPASARAWKTLRPVTIENRDDLDAVRAALGQAIAGL